MARPDNLWSEELFDDAGRKLLRHLAARLNDGTEADDLAQEAYLRMLRAEDSLMIREPRAFAMRVAIHVAYEWGRLSRARREHVGTECLEERESELAGPLEQTAQLQLVALVRRALGDMSHMRRAVVLLHIRDGLSYAQIAEHVGLSVAMVGKHLAAGLEACRQALAQDYVKE